MKLKFAFAFALLFASCSGYRLWQSSDSKNPPSQPSNSNIPIKSYDAENLTAAQNWNLVVNNEYERVAKVSSRASTPDSETIANLRVRCGSGVDGGAMVEYQVFDPEKIPNFDFGSSQAGSPFSPERHFVEIRTRTAEGDIAWTFRATGRYEGYAEQSGFVFSPSSKNIPDKTKTFVRLIAEGGAEITMTAYDPQDNQKTIRATFPPIEARSAVALSMKECSRLP